MKIYDLFISHAWKYNDEYYRLEKLLNEYNYFTYRNYSVPEHDPLDFNSVKELVQKLDEQIRQSSVVLVIGGMYCTYRKWIQKEIEIAKKENRLPMDVFLEMKYIQVLKMHLCHVINHIILLHVKMKGIMVDHKKI